MKLILLYGGPGTGKLTIAKELARLTEFTLFHNHMILNALSEIFGYDNPSRRKLEKEFRLRIIEEAAKADINMIATGVIMRDNEDFYKHIIQTVKEHHGECLLVHITANKDVLKQRISDKSRIELKKISTVDRLNEWNMQYPESFKRIHYDNQFTIDTSNLSHQEVADKVMKHYKLK
jgi:shikimate kinase